MKHKQTKNYFYSALIVLTHCTLLPTTYWKWQNINTHAIQFPGSFEWGLTTLGYEVDGYAKSSTWYAWENHVGNNTSEPFTKTRSGKAAAHSQNYKEDVQLITMIMASICISYAGFFYIKKSTKLQSGKLRTFCTFIGMLCICSALFLSFKVLQYADEQFHLL